MAAASPRWMRRLPRRLSTVASLREASTSSGASATSSSRIATERRSEIVAACVSPRLALLPPWMSASFSKAVASSCCSDASCDASPASPSRYCCARCTNSFPRLGGARQRLDGVVELEQDGVGELAHVVEAPLRPRPLLAPPARAAAAIRAGPPRARAPSSAPASSATRLSETELARAIPGSCSASPAPGGPRGAGADRRASCSTEP